MKKHKFVQFMKKYGYYCLAGVLVLAIGLTLAFTAGRSTEETLDISSAQNPVVSVSGEAEPLTFTLPMENAELVNAYAGDGMYWNKTLAWWEAHNGVDITSDNLDVMAIADGTVAEIDTDMFYGTVVTIEHADGLTSVYASLDETLSVKKGDAVKKGTVIGKAAVTMGNEAEEGAHLHLEMYENGEHIDPANYLDFENK